MSDFNVSDEIGEFDVNVRTLYKELKDFIENNPLPEVPDFKDIMVRKGLYTYYGKVVSLSNSVATFSAKVVAMSMLKASYKRIIRNGRYPASIAAEYNNKVDDVSAMVDIVDRLLSSYKYAVDNQLRFYGSIQYILGSPRLSSVE